MKKLILILCLMLSCCTISYSQEIFGGSDNFFNASDWGNRTPIEPSQIDPAALYIMTQNFGEPPAPIGNGLVILGALGLIYLLYKSKKKSIMFISVIICLLSYGCNKKPIQTEVEQPKRVEISFSPRHYLRTDITQNGCVTFSENDVLYLFASGNEEISGRYLGSLTNGATSGSYVTFTGTVGTWQSGEVLSFYYVGLNTVTKDGVTIDFSDQTYDDEVNPDNDLENISKKYHIGLCQITAKDDAVTKNFNGQLRNMMALGVFNTEDFGSSTVKIISTSDLYNIVTIAPDGSIEYGVAGINSNSSVDNQSGQIIIGKGSSKKYVALLPASETQSAKVSLLFTSNYKVSSSDLNLEIMPNSFLHTTSSINNNTHHQDILGYDIIAVDYISDQYIDYPEPTECMSNPHLFSVWEDKGTIKKVVFSQGNLVYDHGRFKQHKYPWETCQIEKNSDINVNSVFDVFGWGASGYTFGQLIYQPYSNSTREYDGSIGFGYGPLGTGSTMYKQSFHPHEKYRKQDWGWYQFGMNLFPEYVISPGNSSYWRTLGQGEWTYIFKTRVTTSTNLIDQATGLEVENARFVKATVNSVKGVLLFPDTYTHPDQSIELSYINAANNNGLTANILTPEQFNELHEAGVEFLPMTGYYNKINESVSNPENGYYWSCKTQQTDKSIYCRISGDITTNTIERYQGLYVRLVFQVDGLIYK